VVAAPDISFSVAPLQTALAEITRLTGYNFLYRESVIAGKVLSLQTSLSNLMPDLERELYRSGIRMQVSHDRMQVILSPSPRRPESFARIRGQVLDAVTGDRLPFATVSWTTDGALRGVAADSDARFVLPGEATSAGPVVLTASYVGYDPLDVSVDPARLTSADEITFRLQPRTLHSAELVITAQDVARPADTLAAGLIAAGRFSPLGETSTIRALQGHPSATAGTAVSEGLTVRGSPPDGFLVTLDGMPLYNQSHLFGLLDSFNADAIRSAGYYMGSAPSYIAMPVGGLLELHTRTGSRSQLRMQSGVSNTSLSTTVEGPLRAKSSFLVSVRSSYMQLLKLPANRRLVRLGLDVRRPVADALQQTYTSEVVRPEEPFVQYLDLHATLNHETVRGARWKTSFYAGGDQTRQPAFRRVRDPDGADGFNFTRVESNNTWGNLILSSRYSTVLAGRLHYAATAGFSLYQTDFEKDDFIYSRVLQQGGSRDVAVFSYPFQNQSVLNNLRFKQDLSVSVRPVVVRGGLALSWLDSAYRERSFDRSLVRVDASALLREAYVHVSGAVGTKVHLEGGSRVYVREGWYWAPAFRAEYRPHSLVNAHVAAGQTWQFTHRVGLQNTTTAGVWVVSAPDQPPAGSRYAEAGLHLGPFAGAGVQLSVYRKSYQNLRFHELNVPSLDNSLSRAPWFYQTDGDASGLEVTGSWQGPWLRLSQSYTWSQALLRNEAVAGGSMYPAAWDRTHQMISTAEITLMPGLRWMLSWTAMTGRPAETGADQRLPAYRRADVSVDYRVKLTSRNRLEIRVSVFNVLDRGNVWYRDTAFILNQDRLIPRLDPVDVDVLDLGRHPSFTVRWLFN